MDSTEQHVQQYLSHSGYTDVVYEPDGNIPPDFLINGRIAAEVRLLNQHVNSGSEPIALEQTAIPLKKTIRRLLQSMGAPRFGVSWYVSYTFSRPIPSKRAIQRGLKQLLNDFASNAIVAERIELELASIRLRLRKRSEIHESMFLLGGSVDHEAGGFTVAELLQNLPICINEKTAKIAKVRDKYPEWWLILVDRIGYGDLDSTEIKELRTGLIRPLEWDRIILVSPADSTQAFDI